MNVQDEIKALKQRIAELEKQQEFPRDGDTYWYVGMRGNIFTSEWEGFPSEEHMLEVGNIFKTEDEAYFAVEKLKVDAELRKFSDSWDLENTQYSFSFNWEFGEFNVEYPDYNQYPNSYYFYSIDDLQQAIESVGEERIKRYIFEVE